MVIIGIIFVFLGIQLISYIGFNSITQLVIIIGGILIYMGVQRTFSIKVIYQSISETLPLAIGGELEFEGNGNIPIKPPHLAEALFPQNNDIVMETVTKDGFFGFISYRNTLTVTKSLLVLTSEQSQITPSQYIAVPLKNIISINVSPKSFRSLPLGILGVLITLGGVFSFLNGAIIGGIISLLLGIGLALYGLAKIMKTVFTFSITGNKIRSVVLEGEIVETSHDIDHMGEVIMGAVVDFQQEQTGTTPEIDEVPAK